MINLDQLVFDPTGPSEGANVGAFLRDSEGNLITSTLIGGTHQALDVNVANSITTTPVSDVSPSSQNITAEDIASTSTSGANGQSIITGSPTSGSMASFTFNTESSVRVQVSGEWSGTLESEISLDSGTTWYPVILYQDSIGLASSYTGNFEGILSVSAATQFRLRATTSWTGTATVLVVESVNESMMYIGNPSLSVAQSGIWTTRIEDSSGNSLSSTSGSLNVDVTNTVPVSQSGSWAVTADQGGSWSVAATQSGTWTVQQGTPPWSVVGNIADNSSDSGDPVKAGSRASFGAALSAVSATNDRADMISDRYRRLFISGSADVAVKNTQVSVGTSAASLLVSQLQGRRKIYIQNNSTKAIIYLGADDTVTSSNGLAVGAGAVFSEEVGEDVSIWVIGSTSSIDVRVYELA